MGLEMKISVDFESVDVFLSDFKSKALVNATRKSMNRSISALRTRTNRTIREERRLKARDINAKYLRVTKAKGSALEKLEASLAVSGRPVSLINFVIGKKEPRNQKGIPVSKRKDLRVEVRPGRRVQLSSAFIAKGRGGVNQVFRRRTNKRFPIVKQSTPALSVLVERDRVRKPLEKFAQSKLNQEFERTFKFELNKVR